VKSVIELSLSRVTEMILRLKINLINIIVHILQIRLETHFTPLHYYRQKSAGYFEVSSLSISNDQV